MCMVTVSICILVVTISNILVSRRSRQDAEDSIKMITAYLAAATEDEYGGISESIRHNLISNGFDANTEDLIQYIPNTAEICWTHWKGNKAQELLVSLNTGYLYELDVYGENELPDDKSDTPNSIRMTFGSDEISEMEIQVEKEADHGKSKATIARGNGTLSFLRMKSNFCDDCIRDILHTIENADVQELVIFDTRERKFYPIEDGSIKIGDYQLMITHEGNNYEIAVSYVSG